LYTTPKKDSYQENYHSTNLWNGFLREDGTLKCAPADKPRVQGYRDTLVEVLKNTFNDRKRCVRISFLFNPGKVIEDPLDDNLHLLFNYLHDGFRNTLQQHSKEALQYLKDFVKLKKKYLDLKELD